MPDAPLTKLHPHPQRAITSAPTILTPSPAPPYAEVQAASNFTFLTGASHPEELIQQAADLGYRGIALTDAHSLAGIVRAHVAAKELGLHFAVGARLTLNCEQDRTINLSAYPTDRDSYGRLCRLLTLGNRRAAKGHCHLTLHDFLEHSPNLLAVLNPPDCIDDAFIQIASGLRDVLSADRLWLAARFAYDGRDEQRLAQRSHLAEHLHLDLIATNDVLHHQPQRKMLADVLTCIREHCTLDDAGFRLAANAERHLKSPAQMHQLFRHHPQALAHSVELLDRAAAFSLDELRYEYPDETCPPGVAPIAHLRHITYAGAAQRYPTGLPQSVRHLIEHELALIDELNYPHYFLTVHDLVNFARSRNILCQGRGAAANSAVCFCLGVTAVDPARIDMLFERFISRERNEPPDIDIDFEHERREEVIQYIYRKYGRDRAALTAEVISYRARMAVREVGKAIGLSLDAVDQLARSIDWFDPHTPQPDKLAAIGIDPHNPTIILFLHLVSQILGFPRHLSQHVGGFVITQRPLCESVPIENAAMPDRTIIQWDKDDIEALGMLKVDVLALGMMTAIRKSIDLINHHHQTDLAFHTIPAEDPATYDMICAADTVGVFQIESRAQMSMLPRLKPRCYYDLVIEVAIVRPGPIVGDMVHPYLNRRNGREPIIYPDERVKRVLGRTLGVPLFQEQAMSLAMACAGFTAGEADQLRRAIAAWKRKQKVILEFGRRIVEGMTAQGYEMHFAQQCFERMKGFSEYGFPESHAASFALIVYASAWLKRHHPAAFAAALLNSQPMGFYQPAQIVHDAQRHGVRVHPVDVNLSTWDCTLEPTQSGPAIRLGLRMVKGLRRIDADAIAAAVAENGPFDSIHRLWRASEVSSAALRRLAQADAFGSMSLDRQRALWQVRALNDQSMPLFDDVQPVEPIELALPPIAPAAQVLGDYASVGLTLKAHPLTFLREQLNRRGVTPNSLLTDPQHVPTGRTVRAAGIVLIRQRPGTASGVVFITLEDETGIVNLVVWPNIYERFRKVARHATLLLARGKVQRDTDGGNVVHVVVQHLLQLDMPGQTLATRPRNFH